MLHLTCPVEYIHYRTSYNMTLFFCLSLFHLQLALFMSIFHRIQGPLRLFGIDGYSYILFSITGPSVLSIREISPLSSANSSSIFSLQRSSNTLWSNNKCPSLFVVQLFPARFSVCPGDLFHF